MSDALTAKQRVLQAKPVEDILDPTVYSRIMTACNHEEPDRVPIWDIINSWPIFQHFAPGETDPIVANAKVFHGLGIDLCWCCPVPVPPETEGQEFEGAHRKGRISGRAHWITEYPIKSIEDINAWHADPLPEEVIWAEAEYILRARDTMAPHTMYVPGYGMGFQASHRMMDLTLFFTALYDCRDDIERIIATLNGHAVQRAEAYAEATLCPLYLIDNDIAYKNATMVSLEMLDELVFPYLAKVCEPLVNAGIQVVYHTDGYIMEIIDRLMDCGVTGLNPLEPLAGNDIPAIKKRYGDKLVLVGGVDCSQLLPLGTPDDVREGTKQMLRDAGHGGGLFIGSSSQIVPTTPVENIFAFYEACHEFGTYPLEI